MKEAEKEQPQIQPKEAAQKAQQIAREYLKQAHEQDRLAQPQWWDQAKNAGLVSSGIQGVVNLTTSAMPSISYVASNVT